MKKIALVIGNAAYSGDALGNPRNDAEDVASKLTSLGFTVHVAMDSSNREMELVLQDFRGELYDADVGLFFFAGHGVQIDGSNYLLALDTDKKSEVDAKHTSLPLDKVIDFMAKAHTPTSIIILDACRDNPWEKKWARSASSHGLASVYAPSGTLIAFATSPGQTACDGPGKRNGSYTEALLEHIGAPDCTVEAMFKRVRNTLSVTTKGKQISWEHTSLAGEFFFNLSVGARIDIYRGTSLRDAALELDCSKASHRLIRDLKIYTWPTQNSALAEFDVAKAETFATDSLFVIGRNIYQAACGNSSSAKLFIDNFIARTSGLRVGKRKALLDGMLFEIFFNKDAALREDLKDNYFNNVFELQKHKSLASSFEFIVECLVPYEHRFFALPGKSDLVVVDVVLEPIYATGKAPIVKQICLAAQDILRPSDDEEMYADDVPQTYTAMYEKDFKQLISKQLAVPLWRLNFGYIGTKSADKMRFPHGWTVKKG